MSVERYIELPGEDDEWITEVFSDDQDQNEIEIANEAPENCDNLYRRDEIKEAVERDNSQASAEAKKEVDASDPIKQKCKYVRFLSKSAGRSRGKMRNPYLYSRRRGTRSVELYKYCDNWHSIREDGAKGPIDTHATEIFGDSVAPDMAVNNLLSRLREPSKM
jgi:hypothetical protein